MGDGDGAGCLRQMVVGQLRFGAIQWRLAKSFTTSWLAVVPSGGRQGPRPIVLRRLRLEGETGGRLDRSRGRRLYPRIDIAAEREDCCGLPAGHAQLSRASD